MSAVTLRHRGPVADVDAGSPVPPPDPSRGASDPAPADVAPGTDGADRPAAEGRPPRTAPLRVLVVDDEPTIRLLLRTVLRRDARFECVGEAVDGRDAVTLAERLQPDVVLLDLLMPGMGGREALPQLRAVSPGSMVLVVSALSSVDEAQASVEAGAFAYLEKSVLGPRLTDVVQEYHERFRQELAGAPAWAADDPRRVRR